MGIRVKVRLRVGEKDAVVSALVNSGFESNEPDICIPLALAEELGVWPSQRVESEEASTAGGEVPVFRVPVSAELQLVLNDKLGEKIQCNIVVNPYVDEVLLSDYVTDELKIIPISFRRGLWRHEKDPAEVIRESERPQYWR
ncbi:MAG: hypothetical protein ACP5KE_06190 [Candidatus Methanodesulfokora sp.]|jgi:hypothetical protein